MVQPGVQTRRRVELGLEGRLGAVRVPYAGWIATALAVIAVAALLYLGRRLYFFGDEWTFALTRRAWTIDSFFVAHNEHLVALLVLTYKLLYSFVGMRTYFPYLLTLELLHAGAGLVLFLLIRRRAGDLLALAALAMFLFIGRGAENLFWAFQIGFVGSVFFGLLSTYLLDSDNLGRRRLALGSLALLASVLFSGVGLFFIAALIVELGLDPRRRSYLIAVAVPVVLYLLWFGVYGIKAVSHHRSPLTLTGFLSLGSYIPTGIGAAISGLLGFGPVWAILVLPIAAVLLSMRYAQRGTIDSRSLGAMTGLLAQFGLAGIVRSQFGDLQAASSRYVYIAAVFLLPLFADALREFPWRSWWRPALALLLVVSLLHSASYLHTFERDRTAVIQAQNAQLSTALVFRGAPDLDLDAGLSIDYNALSLTLRQYYALVDSLGTPFHVAGPQSLAGLVTPAVDQAMLSMFGTRLRVSASPATAQPAATAACQLFDPQSDRYVDLTVRSGDAVDLMPAATTTIDFYLSYLAAPGPAPLRTFTLSAGQVYHVRVPDTGTPIDWHLRLGGTTPGQLSICPAAP